MADQTAPQTAPVEAPESTEQSQEQEVSASPEVAAAPKPVTPAEKKAELKKLKIKYNGKEEEVEFDPNDDEYLAQQFQLAKLGQGKAKQYSDLEKDVVNFITELKKNPKKVLSDPTIGMDVKKFAAQILEEEIENSKKSPEQLEKEKLQSELQAMKEQREKEQKEFQQKEFERLTEQAYLTYETNISNALDKTDLPKSPYVVKKMADYMLLGLQKGVDLTADEVLPLVKDEVMSDIKDMFGVMPEEVIENFIGKDVLNRIRKKNLAKAKAVPPQPISKSIKDSGASASPRDAKGADKMTFKDFFKM